MGKWFAKEANTRKNVKEISSIKMSYHKNQVDGDWEKRIKIFMKTKKKEIPKQMEACMFDFELLKIEKDDWKIKIWIWIVNEKRKSTEKKESY